MRWDLIRKRVQQKIDETGENMAAVSKKLGHSDGFMHAFLVTKKQKSLKMTDIENLASMFKVSDNWLLGLDDGEAAPSNNFISSHEKTALENSGINFSDVVNVGDIEKRRVMFASLDIMNGKCALADSTDGNRNGLIVDPALLMAHNSYVTAFAGRIYLTVSLKRVKTIDGAEVWFVLDSSN